MCTEDPNTWVTQQQFKAGLAIIQAMPGPMFNLSAYLGATIAVRAGWNFTVGVAACWLGLFGPGATPM
ncbi:MAG: chromate transporter [Akkermansiaceae bacterium]|nr:chromate transporter [Akkermansiaceae bacterium]